MKQNWSYDWLGNTTASTDDANLFYDRSLGAIGNDGYRLTSASQPKTGKQPHTVDAAYDPAGYMRSMTVTRPETLCAVDKSCPVQTYEYQWDEVGRLTKATRKDSGVLAAELTYAYDASDQRVRKSAGSRHSIYVFGSLELRSTDFSNGVYTVDNAEVSYLFGHGVRLARVTYVGEGKRRIFLELGDHLGSTSVVMDRETGELVERSTAYAYGAAESNYRPGAWNAFREDYRFTGKEDDIEVGLIYFGARYLNPQLGRWISADPLAVHAPGKADLNLYAYVHGRVLSAVDPVGLAGCGSRTPGSPPPPSDGEVASGLAVGLAKSGGLPTSQTGGLITGRIEIIVVRTGANAAKPGAAAYHATFFGRDELNVSQAAVSAMNKLADIKNARITSQDEVKQIAEFTGSLYEEAHHLNIKRGQKPGNWDTWTKDYSTAKNANGTQTWEPEQTLDEAIGGYVNDRVRIHTEAQLRLSRVGQPGEMTVAEIERSYNAEMKGTEAKSYGYWTNANGGKYFVHDKALPSDVRVYADRTVLEGKMSGDFATDFSSAASSSAPPTK